VGSSIDIAKRGFVVVINGINFLTLSVETDMGKRECDCDFTNVEIQSRHILRVIGN